MQIGSSASAAAELQRVRALLVSLGLEDSVHTFLENGFDSLASIADIADNDMAAMGIASDERRVLKGAAVGLRATSGLPVAATWRPPAGPSRIALPPSHFSSVRDASTSSSGAPTSAGPAQAGRSKRKYVKHPKADANAPVRPQTAYVMHSAAVRADLGPGVSFSEVAKIAGERWKRLDPVRKKRYEDEAARLKAVYDARMVTYRQTEDYRRYQAYVRDFNEQHGIEPKKRGRKPKSDTAAGAQDPSPAVSIASTSPTASLLAPSHHSDDDHAFEEDYFAPKYETGAMPDPFPQLGGQGHSAPPVSPEEDEVWALGSSG